MALGLPKVTVLLGLEVRSRPPMLPIVNDPGWALDPWAPASCL